jgi:hypothetical protein
MLNDLIAHIAKINGLADPIAKQVLGVVLNAADRQASPFASALFKAVPGARTLAARTGTEIGAPTGEIARLIEQTPGGKLIVIQSMISSLHKLGLDHAAIGRLLPAISEFAAANFGVTGFGHLGDLMGSTSESDETRTRAAA